MTTAYRIALEAPPEKATLTDLGAGLRRYNESFTGPSEAVEFVVTLRAADGKFLGGVYCDLYWNALFIKWVWLDESVRDVGAAKIDDCEAVTIREAGLKNAGDCEAR